MLRTSSLTQDHIFWQTQIYGVKPERMGSIDRHRCEPSNIPVTCGARMTFTFFPGRFGVSVSRYSKTLPRGCDIYLQTTYIRGKCHEGGVVPGWEG